MQRASAMILVLVAACALACGGKTRLKVGEDGGAATGGPVADPVEHCREREAWICARRRARSELTPEEERQCIERVEATCAGAGWPPDCRPSTADARRCIEVLMNAASLDTPVERITECQLCG